jgi:hypothetical protein
MHRLCSGYRKVAALAASQPQPVEEGAGQAASVPLTSTVFHEALRSMVAAEGAAAEVVQVHRPDPHSFVQVSSAMSGACTAFTCLACLPFDSDQAWEKNVAVGPTTMLPNVLDAADAQLSVLQDTCQSLMGNKAHAWHTIMVERYALLCLEQVPDPIDKVLPWETVLEDGSIVSNVADKDEGEGLLGVVFGSIGHLLLKALSAVGRRLRVI